MVQVMVGLLHARKKTSAKIGSLALATASL